MSDSDYDFGSEEQSYGYSSDDGFAFDHQAEAETPRRKVAYAVFNEAELEERQREDLAAVTSVLSIPDSDAVRVLRLYKWDINRAQEEWFSSSYDSIREKVGLMDEQPETSGNKEEDCPICFDTYRRGEMCAAGCKHYFCKNCWRGYVATAIENGPSSLSLRCPLPGCSAAVPVSIIEDVASEAEKQRYHQYAVRSFVEDNAKLTWCPAPGCEHAVECYLDINNEPLDISCKCGSHFCFNCKEEAHRPVDCDTVHKWILKNSAESENLNWILANTKPCPKCKRPIEKNQGCMHMNCSQCKHEFCWLCLGAWQEHGERTGGFYACNRYEAAKKRGEYSEEEQAREHAKNSLERYMHYYQRWAENEKARKTAIDTMHEATDEKLEKLSGLTATPTSQLKFVTDAWAQVVDCRRILKWTYAYGYYTFADESKSTEQQKEFFEFTQGQAEAYLEKLHGVAETQMNGFVEGTTDVEHWGKFRENLIGLTDVTRSHFHKLVQELERGLELMLADYSGDQIMEELAPAPKTEGPSGSQASKPGKRARGAKRGRPATRSTTASLGTSSDAAPEPSMEELAGFWQCRVCTFANTDMQATVCETCEQARR